MPESVSLLGPSLGLSAILFSLGVAGVILRRNAIILFVCIELMLNAVNLSFIALGRHFGQINGQMYVIFVMAVAAAEVAIMKRKGDSKVKGVEDLSGLSIGGPVPPSGPTSVLTNYNEGQKASSKAADKIVHFQGDPDLFLALANDQIDAAVETTLVIANAMKKQPDTFEVVGTIGKPFYIGWVTRPDDKGLRDALSAEIRKMRDSGELPKLQEKWFGFKMEIPDSGYLPPNSQ